MRHRQRHRSDHRQDHQHHSAGETDLTWDAGLYQKASIGDRVWLDANKNGVQDSGEAGGWRDRQAAQRRGQTVATATTDANGTTCSATSCRATTPSRCCP